MWAAAPTDTTSEFERVETAQRLMRRFAERTGLTSERASSRYLWTDAFAVCNFLGLARATDDSRYVELALQLVSEVHAVLGRFRDDDPRSGWLSGLREREGTQHPTLGGLRIGKRLPERAENEPFDEQLEWDRDGQYFHYLTKWMHALDQVARFTAEPRFNLWARELAQAAHAAFVRSPPAALGRSHMLWKMSSDLSRTLVPSMGQHDPLDGFVTALELRATASLLPDAASEPDLAHEMSSFAGMVDVTTLATLDPLGIGGLLGDACRVEQLATPKDSEYAKLAGSLLEAATHGLAHYDAREHLRRAPERRLAFRELGLTIGLEGVRLLERQLPALASANELAARLRALEAYLPLADAIASFWLEPKHQQCSSWIGHLDINEVMLATSLLPEGFLLWDVGSTAYPGLK